jgi:deazaflavin-dependent oxidoreductase (nitroreductase family)
LIRSHMPVARVPAVVRLFDPLMRRLLATRLPMGPNTLLTVRGRKTGAPRSAGVAVVEIGTRRWVTGAYGEVQWVKNLRAAGEGEIRINGQVQHVRAVALSPDEAAAFYRDVLKPYVAGLPLLGRWAASVFARDALRDPERAALGHPVFELFADPAP